MWRRSGLTILSTMLLWGCARAPSNPAETYRAFYQAVSNEDWDLAVTFISPRVLDTFAKVGRELQSAVGAEGDPLDFFLQGIRAHVHPPLLSVEQIGQEGQRVKLKVMAGKCDSDAGSDDCLESEVTMVSISGKWFIEPSLPALIVEDTRDKDDAKGTPTGG